MTAKVLAALAVILLVVSLALRAQAPDLHTEYGAVWVAAYEDQAVLTFQVPFASSDACVVTPLSDMGSTRWWITERLDSFTLHVAPPGTATYFSYICRGQ